MADKPYDSWEARAAVSEALEVFHSQYMQDVWLKALGRRQTDPEGAVTSARTLLESVCKFILEEAEKPYRHGAPLPELYRLTSEALEIAPNRETAPILKNLFTACAEIVNNIGSLRNHLSDAHGRGPFGSTPDWRHAELAVHLSGAMATYLSAIWKGREATVKQVIERYLETRGKAEKLGESHVLTLKRAAADPFLGPLVASKLRVSDLIAFCEMRIQQGSKPSTVNQYIAYLRGAMGSRLADVVDEAARIARARKLIATSEQRTRRVSDDEIDILARHYEKQDKHHRTKVPMKEVMHFAVWSGRPVGQIVKLRFIDIDYSKRTCKLPRSQDTFPLLEKAWDIVVARERLEPENPEERIFPYYQKTISARSTLAKGKLSEEMPGLADLRFNDFRFEAVYRLLDLRHPPHQVALATGVPMSKVMKIYKQSESGPL